MKLKVGQSLASVTDNELSWEGVHYLIVAVWDGKVTDRKAWWRDPGVTVLKERPLRIV